MTDVIRRKIDRTRPIPAEGAPGADRGWRLALARAARDAMGLDLEFRSLTIARQSSTEILEQVPDLALIALLDGPRGGLGVIMLAPTVTAALIEKQTIGRLATQAPPARKASRIDAAMVAGVIDSALIELDETLAEEADFSWAGGFRYASYLEDARPLGLLLEEDAYRVLSAEVALGSGARQGRVLLVMPANGRGEVQVIRESRDDAEAPQFTAALSAQVMQSDCRLDAVVGRLTLSLRQILDLQPGGTLVLPNAALDAISLETIEGRRIVGARLGQHRGMRALKLNAAISPQTAATPAARVTPSVAEQPARPELRAAV